MNQSLSSFAARLRELIANPQSVIRNPQFSGLALELFALQFKHNAAYRKICEARKLTPAFLTITKFSLVPELFVRQVFMLCVLLQFALAFLAVAADNVANSEDSSLQSELIEPIGKTPTNNAPVRTDKIKGRDFVGFDQLAGFKLR